VGEAAVAKPPGGSPSALTGGRRQGPLEESANKKGVRQPFYTARWQGVGKPKRSKLRKQETGTRLSRKQNGGFVNAIRVFIRDIAWVDGLTLVFDSGRGGVKVFATRTPKQASTSRREEGDAREKTRVPVDSPPAPSFPDWASTRTQSPLAAEVQLRSAVDPADAK